MMNLLWLIGKAVLSMMPIFYNADTAALAANYLAAVMWGDFYVYTNL